MKIEALTMERVADFVDYCKRYKGEVDDSFLYDEDLRDFKPDEDNPTYIAVNEQNEIIAAASLIIDDYNKRGKKARFRIFHSIAEDKQYSHMLLQALLKHTVGLEKLIIFVPVVNEKLIELMEDLKFITERYSYLLVREDIEVPDFDVPEGYEIRAYKPGQDEEAWCKVRNAAFATLQGSETPVTPEQMKKAVEGDHYIHGGMLMLYHNESPVGVVRGEKDEYEDKPIMNIGPIAIMPEYQGRGLGRSLLRASLQFGKSAGYGRAVLCVNAENDRAKVLYEQEGFTQVEAVACYKYQL